MEIKTRFKIGDFISLRRGGLSFNVQVKRIKVEVRESVTIIEYIVDDHGKRLKLDEEDII